MVRRIPKDLMRRIRLRHQGYHLLLTSLLVFVALLPAATVMPALISISLIALSAVLMGAISRYSSLQKTRKPLYLLGGLAIGMEVLWHLAMTWFPSTGLLLTVPHVMSWVAFLLLSLLRLVRTLIREPFVTVSVVLGAAAGYLLVGVAGGVGLVALWVLHPQSFLAEALPTLPQVTDNAAMLSMGAVHVAPSLMAGAFNLLTTVGSPAINPRDVSAQVVTTMITVSGQLYVAILIALILGRFSSRPR